MTAAHPIDRSAPIWREVERQEARFHALQRGAAARIAGTMPASIEQHLMAGWDARFGDSSLNRSPVARANVFVRETVRSLKARRYRAAYDESLIRDHAENYSMLCAAISTLDGCRMFGAGLGVGPPKARGMTPESERARWIDAHWWRRQLRKAWTRECEESMRALGIIRRGGQPYASDEAVEHRAARQRRTVEWLQARVMVNEQGEQLELLDLHERSLANPALRRGEFMTRMRGFEEIAADMGHVALFFTLTAPSAFHAQRASGGVNPAWETDRARVQDAQGWLRRMWARARAKLARLSITYYGFRVAEPHHDATPHWHMVLFVSPLSAETMRAVLRMVWLSEYAGEFGAAEHRCRCEPIEPGKGSATGYIAKYVAKNIDGAGAIGDQISDETGERVSEGVARVAAWAAAHGIRQFQQVGGPPVGLWREARRVREHLAPALLESVRAPADRGNWREFIGALGGIDRARRRVGSTRSTFRRELRRPMVRYRGGPRGGWRTRPAEDHEMPAAWLDRAEARVTDAAGRDVLASTRYGETPAPRAAALCSFGLLGRYVAADTRPHRWRIERKCTSTSGGTTAANAAARSRGAGNSSTPMAASRTHGAASRSGKNALGDSVLSDLGPVAITVRDGIAPSLSDPAAWTSRETSMAGPHDNARH